jgi:hypothetical protein
MSFSGEEMVNSYNDVIEKCRENPLSTHPTICKIETMVDSSIADRLPRGDEKISMDKTMCSCRITAKIMFVMLDLNITEPIGSKYERTYKDYFEDTNVNRIVDRGLNSTEIDEINSWDRNPNINPNISLLLPPPLPNLLIVQILKRDIRYDRNYYFPLHTFIIKIIKIINETTCEVFSSWFSGEENAVPTPIIFTRLSYADLKYLLTPPIKPNILFGIDNSLDVEPGVEIKTIFISKAALTFQGGRKITRKRKRSQKIKKGKKKRKSRKMKRKKSGGRGGRSRGGRSRGCRRGRRSR